MGDARTLFLSGIPLEEVGGTSRFLRRLRSEYESSDEIHASIEFKSHMNPFRKARRRLLGRIDQYVPVASKPPRSYIEADRLVLFHPQAIGYRFATNLLRSREHSWHFILDTSFFCRKSYNHVEGEHGACTRCLEDGPDAAIKMECGHFPYIQGGFDHYQRLLRHAGGKISYFVQSETVAEQLRVAVGTQPRIEVVGMSADFSTDEIEAIGEADSKQIVFHSNPLEAKGHLWAIDLAREMPDWKFLFPFSAGQLKGAMPPENCEFRPMTWESGLQEAVQRSAGVLCPSLWSAPIEGAFVKSVLLGHTVGYVDVPSAATSRFESDEACVALDSNPSKAAQQMKKGLEIAVTRDMRQNRLEDIQRFVGFERERTQIERMMHLINEC